MLLSTLLLVPANFAHATGQVNINGGSPLLVPQAQTTLSVPIQISGSDALNGFDVQVFADPTILSGASISLTGSVIPSPTIVIECINGVLVAGTTCAPQDASGVVHLGAVHIGSLVAAPVSGLLFTINYNIVGHSSGTPISFNTGCSGTSVGTDCVTVSNGTPTAVSETDLGTTFANLNDFSMTPTFARLSTPASTAITDAINFAALGGFSDTLNVATTGPCTLSAPSVDLTFPSGTDTLSCSSTSNGDFTATVTATGFTSSLSHSATIPVHVGPAGFSTALPANVTVIAGTSSSTTITVTGFSSFSGTVTLTATSTTAGITAAASPSMVTLTHDASGYSTATSTLTVSVAASVASGTYSLSVTGASAALPIIVPSRDFSLVTTPTSEGVPRGGAVVATITLTSTGSFAGTVNLSASVVANGLDPGTGVNNIVSTFTPPSVTLTAGGSATVGLAASTIKIGTSPNPGNTATGNYTLTITATGASSPHTAIITFNVFDFSLGPNFCAGNNQIIFTSNANDAFFTPVSVGAQCNTFTVTTQTTAQGGGQSTLWMQVNSLGGLQTHGAAGTGVVAAVNPFGPGRGTRVPALHRNVCFFQVFLPNGTQLSRPYIAANGPIVRAGPFGGCRFSFAYAVPNDVDSPTCSPGMVNATCAVVNNVDFYAVTADALPNTLPGTYLINVCGLIGTLLNCQMVTLDVVQAAIVHQFVFTHTVSVSTGGLQSFKLGVTNPDLNFAVFAQVTVTATDQFGGSVSVSTAVIKINANANANNLALSLKFTSADVGKTFTFSTSILESATDPGAVTVDQVNGTTSAGTSTEQSVIAIFTVVN